MRRRRSSVIELTPLLDVIMIILFLVLSQTSGAVSDMKEQNEALSEQLSEAGAQYEELSGELMQVQSELNGFESMNENSVVVAVGIFRGSDDRRTITVTAGDNTKEITYDWNSLSYGEAALQKELSRICGENSDKAVFVSFTYDSRSLFRRDYELISAVLSKTGDSAERIFISYNDMNERAN